MMRTLLAFLIAAVPVSAEIAAVSKSRATPPDTITAETIKAKDADGLALQDKDGTSGLFIEDGGEVGIGTTAPTDPLHIISATDAEGLRLENTTARTQLKLVTPANHASTISFEDGNDAEYAAIVGDFDNSVMLRIYTDNPAGEIAFETASQSEAMRIEAGGDVGIGTTDPTKKLHVAAGDGAVWKFGEETNLADDGTVALTTNYGDAGIITIVGSGNSAYCSFIIRSSENLVVEIFDAGGKCDTTDLQGSVVVGTATASTYEINNRSGAEIDLTVEYKGR